MVFIPKLSNGQNAQLPWQIRLFYVLDITWPVDNQDSFRYKLFHYAKVGFVLTYYIYITLIFFDYVRIYLVLKDIGKMIACIAYGLNLIEAILRTIVLLHKSKGFKSILEEFYQKIYLERVDNIQVRRYMERHLLPTKMSSYFMALTLVCFWAIPIYSLIKGLTILPFPIGFFYDYRKMHLYIVTSFFLCIMATTLGTHLIAESNMIAIFIAHLNGRYLILQDDIKNLYKEVSGMESGEEQFCLIFHKRIKKLYRWNEELNRFSQKIQDLYSLIFLIIMMNNLFLLCTLSFEISTAEKLSDAVSYIFWFLSKVIDLVIIGKLGTSLADTTNRMSSTYYNCNWELISMMDCKTEDKIKLLKFIRMAICLNQQPFVLNALNFFNVNLEVVVAILKGAGSYFTFLYNFRE